jgi:hypothetical protein
MLFTYLDAKGFTYIFKSSCALQQVCNRQLFLGHFHQLSISTNELVTIAHGWILLAEETTGLRSIGGAVGASAANRAITFSSSDITKYTCAMSWLATWPLQLR